jgi:hypothetical protein
MTAPPTVAVPPGRDVACPACGPLDTVAVKPYTPKGKHRRSMHLRAACPRCGEWAVTPRGPWWVPRTLAGLPPRTGGDR